MRVAEPSTVDEAQRVPSFDDLYAEQWWPMLRVAIGLVDERAAAEDVVQDAFTAVYRRWDAIASPEAAVRYLRVAVINTSRNVIRRRGVARRHRYVDDEVGEAADHTTLLAAEHVLVRDALGTLPRRQREVITLRFLAGLDDDQIADATGLSHGGVRSASSRGLQTLRTILDGEL